MPTQGITQSTLPQAPIKPFNANVTSTLAITPPQPVVSPIQPQQAQAPVSQGTAQPQTMEDGSQVDPSIVALMHGLKTAEGAVGNYNAVGDGGTAAGVGQWSNQFNGKVQPLKAGDIPNNFKGEAETYGFDPNDFSPENQNKVLYAEIAAGKKAGLSPEQILSKHNSGDANKYLTSPTGSGQVGAYDVAGYVQRGMAAAQQYASQNVQNAPMAGANAASGQTQEAPSIGGFLGNVVKSGANFLGNIGEAILHPINTVENIGGAAVGALDELGGQTNDETAKFDNLKNYFVQRYGGVSNLEHTLYTDPVGFAADLSTVFGTGAGIAGLGAKAAELGGLGEVGSVASETAAATEASGLAGSLKATASALGTGAKYSNPLTPIVAGAGAALNKTRDLSDVIANPKDYTPENIANASGEKIVNDVETAFEEKRAALSETGSGYDPIRQGTSESTGVSQGGTNQIPVAHDFLENQLRTVAKLDVVDGKILPTTVSTLEKSDLPKLQSILDTYKPAFQSGHISPEEFLALRTKLADAAYNDLGIKNTKIASIAEDLRNNLNSEYRSSVPGLTELDNEYSIQRNNLNELKDGLIYKTGANKGQIKTSFLNSAMKAVKNEDTDKLAQLENIVPGITKRLQIMKTIKDLGDPSFTTTLVEKGGVAGGLITGNIKGAALALSSIILSQPAVALPLMRAVGASIDVVKAVMTNLAKSLTVGAVSNNVQQTTQQMPVSQTTTNPPQETAASQTAQIENPSDLNSLATNKGFDLDAARKAGYSDADIEQFLQTN